jgi:hypothetical protein
MQDRRNYPTSSKAAGRVRRPKFKGVISSVLHFCPAFLESLKLLSWNSCQRPIKTVTDQGLGTPIKSPDTPD